MRTELERSKCDFRVPAVQTSSLPKKVVKGLTRLQDDTPLTQVTQASFQNAQGHINISDHAQLRRCLMAAALYTTLPPVAMTRSCCGRTDKTARFQLNESHC